MYLPPGAIRRFYWLVRSMDLLFAPGPNCGRSARANRRNESSHSAAPMTVLLGAVVGIRNSLSYSAAVLSLVCAAIFVTR